MFGYVVIWVFLAVVGFVAAPPTDHAKYPKSGQTLSPYLLALIPNVCMCIIFVWVVLCVEAWAGGSYGAHVSNLLNHESQSMKAIT